uniref:Uncharacterized protein n=1 Tax=Arundo donax TaxID=35708 RepID=A0A0A9HLA4_ARUDO
MPAGTMNQPRVLNRYLCSHHMHIMVFAMQNISALPPVTE